MEKFILYIKQGKGIGALFLLATAVLVTMVLMMSVKNLYSDAKPEVLLVANEFLPLTIENGKVVEPAGSYKKIDIDLGQKGRPEDLFSVVLDTRPDAQTPSINDLGLYILTDNIYLVSPNQLKKVNFPDGSYTKENFPGIMDDFVGYVSAVVTLVLLVMFFMAYLIKAGFVLLFTIFALKLLKQRDLISNKPLMRLSAVAVALVELILFLLENVFSFAVSGLVGFVIALILVWGFVFRFMLKAE